jgi:hypothetical protein
VTLRTTFLSQVNPALSWALPLLPAGVSISPVIKGSITLENGSASGQADGILIAERTLVSSAVDNLVLDDDSLADPQGLPLSFASVKGIWVMPTVGADGLIVGAPGAGGFVGPFGGTSHKLTVPLLSPLALVHPTTGWAVGAAEFLRFAAGASGVTYSLILVGVRA